MLVPRSYLYATSPPMDRVNEKSEKRSMRKASSIHPPRRPMSVEPLSPKRAPSEPVTIPVSRPVNTSKSQRMQESNESHPEPPFRNTSLDGSRRRNTSSTHDPNALSPSVAALLAVTTIPRRRSNRYRSRPNSDRRISIEELIHEWKCEGSLKSSLGTSPVLSALLENTEDGEGQVSQSEGAVESHFLKTRSASSESVPSLEADDRSILSIGSPSTPGSLRSRRSLSNLKRPRNVGIVEECALDHPLVPSPADDDDDDYDDFHFSTQKRLPQLAKTRSSFKSNLTASLQNLKNAAISSITSLGRATNAVPPPTSSHRPAAPAMDEMLWSHPFLFPSFSSEIRPAIEGSASEAHRRYLNPAPLTFEEQEAPFQQALHAPYLAAALSEAHPRAPTIQMQTYTRSGGGNGRRGTSKPSLSRRHGGNGSRGNGPDPNSEAGRALLSSPGGGSGGVDARPPREIRENSDFLRVVVLEMNMRREGKLDSGRARIWLPPRAEFGAPAPVNGAGVPSRWVGESAY